MLYAKYLENSQRPATRWSDFRPEDMKAIIGVGIDDLFLFTTANSLNTPGPMHACVMMGFDHETQQRTAVLIDRRLFVGEIGQGTVDLMMRSALANRKNSSRYNRPSLSQELRDIAIYNFEQDPMRWTKFRAVKTLILISGGDSIELVWDTEVYKPIKAKNNQKQIL